MSEIPVPTARTVDARELAIRIARTADEMKCRDVVVLELGERSAVADYFVLATGTSERQVRSTADEIMDTVREARGSRPMGREGLDAAKWILLDYVDVVVHLFDGPSRAFYDLELLWGDSPRVDWHDPNRPRRADEDVTVGAPVSGPAVRMSPMHDDEDDGSDVSTLSEDEYLAGDFADLGPPGGLDVGDLDDRPLTPEEIAAAEALAGEETGDDAAEEEETDDEDTGHDR
jgi:ribosome-associated protein